MEKFAWKNEQRHQLTNEGKEQQDKGSIETQEVPTDSTKLHFSSNLPMIDVTLLNQTFNAMRSKDDVAVQLPKQTNCTQVHFAFYSLPHQSCSGFQNGYNPSNTRVLPLRTIL